MKAIYLSVLYFLMIIISLVNAQAQSWKQDIMISDSECESTWVGDSPCAGTSFYTCSDFDQTNSNHSNPKIYLNLYGAFGCGVEGEVDVYLNGEYVASTYVDPSNGACGCSIDANVLNFDGISVQDKTDYKFGDYNLLSVSSPTSSSLCYCAGEVIGTYTGESPLPLPGEGGGGSGVIWCILGIGFAVFAAVLAIAGIIVGGMYYRKRRIQEYKILDFDQQFGDDFS